MRNNSSVEALFVKNLLKDFSIDLDILKWNGKKPKNNIQSLARKKRYNLLINQSKKFKINNILFGHHEDDVCENFFIRLLRGSGLKGIVSLDKTTLINNVNILRPLINVEKKDLIYISKKVFNKYVEDPSNEDEIFTRVRVRNLIKNLESEGLDKSKFKLSINNLKSVDQSIQFFCEKNLKENSIISHNKVVLKKEFFNFPQEILFRSFSKILQLVGKKYFPPRGKKITNILENLESKITFKSTLGNCVIKKNQENCNCI